MTARNPNPSATSDAPILFSELAANPGCLGVVTLNRPRSLNALNGEMIHKLYHKLIEWQNNPAIKAVLVRGSGRAFCAGGDLKSLYDNQHDCPHTFEFFEREYTLNSLIYHFPKPYLSFLDGITMGGGAGISIHGSHRLGTENLIFAMPEASIGFFPDVGSAFFLSRLSHHVGYYLGLTATSIDVANAHWLGLITHPVASKDQETIIQALQTTWFPTGDEQAINAILRPFVTEFSSPALSFECDDINDVFSSHTIEGIYENIRTHASPFIQNLEKILNKLSPTSLIVSLEHLIRAQQKTFDESLIEDLQLAKVFLQNSDFYEGIRAVIIDKDKSPRWSPNKIKDLTPTILQRFFN